MDPLPWAARFRAGFAARFQSEETLLDRPSQDVVDGQGAFFSASPFQWARLMARCVRIGLVSL